MQYVFAIHSRAKLRDAGGKAESLLFLSKQDVSVPKSHVIVWDAFLAYQEGNTAVIPHLRNQLTKIINPDKAYAVRSSANVEDGGEHSFAGQFYSELNVNGLEQILEAIQSVWQSAENDALQPYLTQAGLAQSDLKMAVVVQEMVTPVASGVAFSKNPLTGLDETIVEAVMGSGEALVQGGATPMRWVHKWGELIETAVSPHIPPPVIDTVIAQTKQLAKAYGSPVDLEWVWDGTAVHWLQIRPITTIGNLNIYSNRISREVMPGIIKPLIWSVNVPLVNSAWVDLITELIGEHDIQPEDLAQSFHYRSYFNMGTLGKVFTTLGMPVETLELMMGIEGGKDKPRYKPSRTTYKYTPNMLRFLWHKLRYSREIERFLPKAETTYAKYARQSLNEMDEPTLLAQIDKLFRFTQKMAYVNVVGPLLMLAHNNRFQKQLESLGIDYANFDLMHDTPELAQYDPSGHLDRLAETFAALSPERQTSLRDEPAAEFAALPAANEFRKGVEKFVAQFGHFSDSGNDFSSVPWRENVPFVVEMAAQHVRGETAVSKQNWHTLPISGWQRWRLRRSYERARRFRLYRERISYDYTLGYGLFRNYFMALAHRLVNRSVLHEPDDIFYLYWRELKQLVQGNLKEDPLALINARRDEIEAVRDVIMLDIVYGDEPPLVETAVSTQNNLKGIPTSRGYYQGKVRVIRSVQEFDKMVSGAVIVVPFSDVSWTPLFAKAGAVIAESGGMLSHSSIVAREFNIPAVVSVTHATRMLTDGDEVRLDGYKGSITVIKTEHNEDKTILRDT